MRLVFIVSCAISVVWSHKTYQALIPNGETVPNPCSSGMWGAIGHFSPAHENGEKNKFGQDFAAAGHAWTLSLCRTDSDGDGVSNGDELGDPLCVWTPGSTPTNEPTGHPGICEPIGSEQCAQDTFRCGGSRYMGYMGYGCMGCPGCMGMGK